MSIPVTNPEKYCPICGCRLLRRLEHRCNARTLTAMNGARPLDDAQARTPNLARRFRDAFQSLDMEDDGNNELADICFVQGDGEIMHWF